MVTDTSEAWEENDAYCCRDSCDVRRRCSCRKLDVERTADRTRARDLGRWVCRGARVIGSQDLTGPYDVVKGWPKDISTQPGNEKWTYGAGQGVFARARTAAPTRII
jgi:hypothetical protein